MIPVKTAVVGFGLSGRVFHTPFLHASEQFDLCRIVQRSSRSAEETYRYVELSTFQQVLDDNEIELVVVATPNRFHSEMAAAVLEARKHVIVEKPFVPSLEEGRELIDCAGKAGRNLFVFHNRRWDGDFLTVRKVLESGMLGRIVEYEAHYDRYKPELNAKQWKESGEPSISILHDLGTHIIDQAVALFGRPEEVTAKLAIQREKSRIFDSFSLILGYPGRFQATLKSSLLVKEQGPRYIIHGDSGSFVKSGIDPQEDDLQLGISPLDPDWGLEDEENWGVLNCNSGGLDFRGTVRTVPGNYMHFYQNVYETIRNGADMILPAAEALVTPAIIDAAFMSHEEKRTVALAV